MGQATADLPDPLAQSPAGSTSTDDLLAQLAGEEIERLLAETETVPEPLPTPAPVIPQPLATPAPSPVPAPAATQGASPDAESTPSHEADLEAIFTQLDERDQAVASAQATPAAPEPKSMGAAIEAPSVAEALAAEMAEDEAQHARPVGGHATVHLTDSHAPSGDAVSQNEKRPSLALMLLAMVSSPLDAFPDQIRDLIGKAAILTLLNALCVLAYVLFIRR